MGVIDIDFRGHLAISNSTKRRSTSILYTDLGRPRGVTGPKRALDSYYFLSYFLLQHGASVNKPDFYGLTGLQYAAEFNHTDIMLCLMEKGAYQNNTCSVSLFVFPPKMLFVRIVSAKP